MLSNSYHRLYRVKSENSQTIDPYFALMINHWHNRCING